MQENRNRRLQRYHHYINRKQPQFEVTPYLDNPHMIQSLHEHHVNAMEWAKHVEEQLDLAEEQIDRLEERRRELELEKQKLEIEFAGTISRAEMLDTEKREMRAEIKTLINQLTEANTAKHEMSLQNTAFEFRLNDAVSKLEMQDIQMKDALTKYHNLEELIKDLQLANHRMELDNLQLELQLNIANNRLDEVRGKWRTFPQYVVTIVATAILSFGTSIVASSPSSVPGWGMVIAGGILEIVAFVITLTSRPNRIASLKRIAEPERTAELERTAENG